MIFFFFLFLLLARLGGKEVRGGKEGEKEVRG